MRPAHDGGAPPSATTTPAYVRTDLGYGSTVINVHAVTAPQKIEGIRRTAARFLPRAAGRGTDARLAWALRELPAPEAYTGMQRPFDPDIDADGLLIYAAPLYALPLLLFCTQVRHGRGQDTVKMCYLIGERDVYLVSAHMPPEWFDTNFLCQGLLDLTSGEFLVERLYRYNGVDVYKTTHEPWDSASSDLNKARMCNVVAHVELWNAYRPVQDRVERDVQAYDRGGGDRSRPPKRDPLRVRVPVVTKTTKELYYAFVVPPRVDEYVQYRLIEADRPFVVWTNHCYVAPPQPSLPPRTLLLEAYDPDNPGVEEYDPDAWGTGTNAVEADHETWAPVPEYTTSRSRYG